MKKEWTGRLSSGEESREKTITEQMGAIIDEICNNYCKYPEACMSEREDLDAAEALLYETYCAKCPLMKW